MKRSDIVWFFVQAAIVFGVFHFYVQIGATEQPAAFLLIGTVIAVVLKWVCVRLWRILRWASGSVNPQ